MHTTKLLTTDGSVGSASDDAVDRDATPVVLEHTNDAGTLTGLVANYASLYEKIVDEESGQITYKLKTCGTEVAGATVVCHKQAAFVVEYRGGTVIDPDTGIARERVTFVGGGDAAIDAHGKNTRAGWYGRWNSSDVD